MLLNYWVLITRRPFQFGSPNPLSREWFPAIRMTHLRQVLSVVDEHILNPGFVTDPLMNSTAHYLVSSTSIGREFS